MVEEVVVPESLTRGQKIALALKGKKWSDERKKSFSDKAKAARELWEKNELDESGKRKGYKLGRKVKAV